MDRQIRRAAGFEDRSGIVAGALPGKVLAVFRFGSAAVGLGVLVGLWLAAAYGFWRPWLVASYVLAVIAALNGAIIEGGWARRLVAASPDGVASILTEPLPRLANWVGLALWAVLLWLMVAKPGG